MSFHVPHKQTIPCEGDDNDDDDTTMDTTTTTVVVVATFAMAMASAIHSSLSLMAAFSGALCSQLMASLLLLLLPSLSWHQTCRRLHNITELSLSSSRGSATRELT
jgi:hypothetical protein